MELYNSSSDYLYHLHATSSSDAKRLWRQNIKDAWNNECAYCKSEENITLDHILPQCRGGSDIKTNVVACCHSCNQSKGHTPWEQWYNSQYFFSHENYEKINDWMKPEAPSNLYRYPPRRRIN